VIGLVLCPELSSTCRRGVKYRTGAVLGEQALLDRFQLFGVLRLLCARVLVDPGLDALASPAVRLIEPCLSKRNRKTVAAIRLVVNRG
jgi:hypothetical protein